MRNKQFVCFKIFSTADTTIAIGIQVYFKFRTVFRTFAINALLDYDPIVNYQVNRLIKNFIVTSFLIILFVKRTQPISAKLISKARYLDLSEDEHTQ